MFDIGRIVMAFTDAEERRELDESLVEEYYDYLKTAVEKKGKNLTFGIEEVSIKVESSCSLRGI